MAFLRFERHIDIEAAKSEQDARYHSNAWDALIERWLLFEKRPGAGDRNRAGAVDQERPDAHRGVSEGQRPAKVPGSGRQRARKIGRASCRERVCQYV